MVYAASQRFYWVKGEEEVEGGNGKCYSSFVILLLFAGEFTSLLYQQKTMFLFL